MDNFKPDTFFEQPIVRTPLYELNASLMRQHSETSVIMAFDKYVKEEFADLGLCGDELYELNDKRVVDGYAGDRYDKEFMMIGNDFLQSMRVNHNLLDPSLFNDPENGIEKGIEAYRIALLDVVKFRMITETAADFEQWLPRIMNAIIPNESPHGVDTCPRDEDPLNDMNCRQNARQCPVKAIKKFVVDACVSPDLDNDEYVMDADQAAMKTTALLSVATRLRIIPDSEVDQLDSCLQSRFKAYLSAHQ